MSRDRPPPGPGRLHRPADLVVEHARRAADQAFRMFAWSDAAHYYEAASAAAESSQCLSVQEQADLQYWAGLAHYHDQDVGPCLHHYERAIEGYRASGDMRGLARALMEQHADAVHAGRGPAWHSRGPHAAGGRAGRAGRDVSPPERAHCGRDVRGVSERTPAREGPRTGAASTGDRTRAAGRPPLRLCELRAGLSHINGLQVREALAGWETASSTRGGPTTSSARAGSCTACRSR